MAHRPHVFVPPPWSGDMLALAPETVHHLGKVLRRAEGSVSYTDGFGTRGTGTLVDSSISRGEESVEAPSEVMLTLAVAPPKSASRQRFLVEKAAELGVARLRWLNTRYGNGKPPKRDKARAWAVSALEQSRRAWLMDVTSELATLDELGPNAIMADPSGAGIGELVRSGAATVAIGPEGGWAPEELLETRIRLGNGVLRTETAAIVAAALFLTNR